MHKFDFVQPQRQQFKGDLSLDEQEARAKPFDLADPFAIEANRYGELTQAQIKMFKQASLPPVGWLLYLSPIVAVFLWIWGVYSSLYILVVLLFFAAWLIGPGVCFPMLNLIRRQRLKAVLADGKVEQVSGDVARIGQRSFARGGERRLQMVDTMYPLPPEGNYLFFLLAGTNYLLSAQSLDGSEPGVMDQQAGERLLVGLSRANSFRLDELATNREGRLSDRQRARLSLHLALTCIGGLLTMAGIPLGMYLFVQWNLARMSWVAWPLGVLGGLLLLGIVFTCSMQTVLLNRDWREERVVPLEGKVERLASRANESSSATYQYTSHDFVYKVSKAAYRALAPGLRYRIYQSPHAHRLMSLEPLESDVSH